MPNFIFTAHAEADLTDIVDFTVKQWGAKKAHEYINGLEEIAQKLADNPNAGLNRENLLEGLLCFPYESHTLYYFKQSDGIVIIRVLHQSMDAEKHI